MGLTADDFFNVLVKLLPSGPVWDLDNNELQPQLDAWAQEFARIQARAENLIAEADPRSTFELLPDYERVFGLPTTCMAGINQTIEQRRNSLVAQMTSTGGQSRQYFIDIAANAGYTITITEFTPFRANSRVNDRVYGQDWQFAWQVNSALNTIKFFTTQSAVNERLSTFGNELLECLINRFKPAHTTVIFAYT